jgi:hypothetical protein
MKKIIYMTGLICMALFSCKKSFLTLVPQSTVTDAAFYKTTSDITTSVNASYAALQAQYLGLNTTNATFPTLMETRSDNIQDQNPGANAGTQYNIDQFLAKSDNSDIQTSYGNLYNGISRCNTTLSHIDVVTNATLKNQYTGELKFLRALQYFNVVRLWGPAPLVLAPISAADAAALSRSSVAAVYGAIETDLTDAIGSLPVNYSSTTDLGRATQGAAKALLGKVYLTEGKYSQAVSTLKDLITTGNSYGYALMPNITSVFDVNNKMNAEIIFAVRYNKTIANEGHPLNPYFNQPFLDPNLLRAYGSTDTRRDLLNTVIVDANNKPVKKYYDTFDVNNKTLGNDFIVIRYADVLLMYAEAENEVAYSADAFIYLNAVRSRANATTFTQVNISDQATFRTTVLQERRLELPLELHRWFDLIRTNTAISALQNSGLNNITIQAYQFLFPIPQTELNVTTNKSGFTQNPGY